MVNTFILNLLRDPELRAELVGVLREAMPAPSPPPAIHMTRAEYARTRGISGATVSRLIANGMPTIPIGSTYRIDAVAADEWRRTRERRPTSSKAKVHDVDVSRSLSAAGLKVTS